MSKDEVSLKLLLKRNQYKMKGILLLIWIMWHTDLFPGNSCETNNGMTSDARWQILDKLE
jgi:hypothetical protein